ncbi:MAG TPA: VWA domain-containing protein, partial [Anaerolineaceae bacterium]|nr:VWA domain-containing protein [Anaerolineaceae bacterium]
MKKSLPQITFTIIIAIGYLFSTISGVTHANNQLQESTSPAGDCFGLDVVFLVDQSSSMSGGSNGLASDPQEQRKYAVEAAVNQLTDIALDSCPDVVHRVAVVSFGSTVRTDVEFTTIDPENLDDSLWIRENISSKLMADSMNAT